MPIRVVQSTAASAARNLDTVVLDVFSNDFKVQWSFNRTGNGHCEATVQYTLDDLKDQSVSALWITEKVLTTADAATAMTMTHPATGMRLAIVSASGNNQIAFRVLQTGS